MREARKEMCRFEVFTVRLKFVEKERDFGRGSTLEKHVKICIDYGNHKGGKY